VRRGRGRGCLGKRRRGKVVEEEGELWARLGQPVEAEPGPYWAVERGRTQVTLNRFQEVDFSGSEKLGRKSKLKK
jgi:hypothetical protein